MSDVIIRTENKTGRITLNRPEALNALGWAMVLEIEKTLLAWHDDPEIEQVLIDAAGDRAFCAGGDIVEIYEEGKRGENKNANQFWRDEYRLNAMIAGFPKPYIAVMDGFVMGGGVGISAHGSHRVVTEHTQFAMPECGIGLNPDVGGTLVLAKMPGAFGEYCGLTGARLDGADCMALGVGTHYVPSASIEEMKARIVEQGVDQFEGFDFDPSPLLAEQSRIDAVFSKSDLGEIIEHCQGSERLDRAARAMVHNAPLSMLIALETIRSSRDHGDIKLALRDEYRASSRALVDGEMVEGIRAAVIDKDRNPAWKYPRIEDVPAELVLLMQSEAEGGDVEV